MNSVQNIACNSFDRVPPLHQHMPQDNMWTEEVARKKAKTVKSSYKKQRQHANSIELRSNNSLDQCMSGDEFSDKINSQSGRNYF